MLTSKTDKSERTAKIRFLADNYKGERDFKVGEIRELPLPTCERWVRRGVAEYVGSGPLHKAALEHTPTPPVQPEPDEADEADDGEADDQAQPRKRGRPKGVRRGGL